MTTGMTTGTDCPEILHDIRIVDLTRRDRGIDRDPAPRRGGCRRRDGGTAGGKGQSLGARVPHLGPEQAQRRPRHRDPRGSRRARSAARGGRRPGPQLRPHARRRARARRRVAGAHASRPDRLLGALVAGQPRRRRPPRRRAAGDGRASASSTSSRATATARCSSGSPSATGRPRTSSPSASSPGCWCASGREAADRCTRASPRAALVPMAMHWQRAETPSPSLAGRECPRATPWRRCSSAPTACGSTTWAEPSCRR